ncbi:MAG: tetratricopeptide repeat protein [Myxococcota bacterium]
MGRYLLLALAFCLGSSSTLARTGQQPRPTVVVAPLTSSGAEEHGWIGDAFAESLSSRLLSSGSANVLSQRQWAAALRERNIAALDVKGDADARVVGQRLGADLVVVGSYMAAWPDVTVWVRLVPVAGGEAVASAEARGHLEELPRLEAQLAKQLFRAELGKAAAARGAPRNVYAWHSLTRCTSALSLQSLGPRARPWLPRAMVEQAVAACDEALRRDKSLLEAESFRALGLALLGETTKARLVARGAARRAKTPGWPHLIAYYTAHAAGDDVEAESYLAAAIKQRPGFLHAHTTLGEAQLDRGALAEARATFEGSLRECPRQPWTQVQLSKVLGREGKIDDALARLDEALIQVPGDPLLLLEKGSRYIDGKRWDDAERTLRASMEQDPRIAATYLRLGYVYLEQDKRELAGAILQKALVEADLESEARVRGYAHFDLAKLHARQGNKTKATEHLKLAAEAGFADKNSVVHDSDLAILADDPEVSALLQP